MGIIVIKSLQLIEFRNSDREDKLLASCLLINTVWRLWEECESFLNFWSSVLAMSRNTIYLVKVCHIYFCLQLSGTENGALLRKAHGQIVGRLEQVAYSSHRCKTRVRQSDPAFAFAPLWVTSFVEKCQAVSYAKGRRKWETAVQGSVPTACSKASPRIPYGHTFHSDVRRFLAKRQCKNYCHVRSKQSEG